MADVRSHLTSVLSRAARLLPQDNRMRRGLSAAWDRLLRLTGGHITVWVGGRAIRLPVAYRALDPRYEARALRVWLRLVKPGDAVWDVGANFGIYTVLTGLAVGPEGAVVAWEPAPPTYQALRDHLTANGLDGWCEALQAAVADVDGGTLPFTVLSGPNNPMNRLGGTEAGTKVHVPVGTLDGWLDRLGRAPRLVKIDIEGAEVLALRGAARLLGPEGPRPVLLVAVHPPFLPEFRCSTADLPPLLDRYQYVCRDLAGRPAQPADLTEYLFIPRGREEEVLALLGG
jgi:FkbM family methyltransferase